MHDAAQTVCHGVCNLQVQMAWGRVKTPVGMTA